MKELLKNEKLLKVIFFAGIAVIAILFLSEFAGSMTNSSKPADESENLYIEETQLEQRLVDILEKIVGVSEVSVMLTLDSKQEQVQGVTVVCSGVENPSVKAKVIDAVAKTLKISSARICVTE